jgi:hypothetical protein
VVLHGAVKHAAAEAEDAVEEAGHKAGAALSAVKHKTVDPVGHAASSAAHSMSHAAGSAKDAIVGKGERQCDRECAALYQARRVLECLMYNCDKGGSPTNR